MDISPHDRDILRRLAEEWATAAADPVQAERADLWRRLNRLERVKPLIWINEIPWHEMNVNEELTLRCEAPFCRQHERTLRQTLYQWRHMPGDMTIEPVFYSPLVIQDTGFGIDEEVDIVRTDEASDIVSRHFHEQIDSEADLAKIKMPRVTHDAEASERNFQALSEAIGDIVRVEKRGAPGFWFAPWDELIRWWSVEKAMIDLVLRPELVHAAMERLIQAYLTRLDQYEAQGLLSLNNNNVRVGSGGYGYSDELPQPDFDPAHVRPIDLWGCGTAQIFGAVSPAMHEEFALQYERRWMERFGLNYYGCCEPLHLKVDMLRSIPRLRKISMSPWADVDIAVRNVGDEFVFSHKPNPAIFAEDIWKPAKARQMLVNVLERTRGCCVEVIMKDISTVRYQPQRLWEWSVIAQEVTAQYA
ncbi:MAG: hypothetical protein H5T69_09890 [Chloroflexi bacterium]|nr:hypothetical protein [Chloroflexota bacterium]